MTSKPLLTIGIVTYNNPFGCKDEIAFFLSERNSDPSYEKRVEIIVSDNSESDDTKKIIDEQFGSVEHFLYIKNERNIGYDRNVDQVLSKASGTFCWTLSDNDIPKRGTLGNVLHILETSPEVGHFIISDSERILDTHTYENMDILLREHRYASFIGGLVSRNIFVTRFLPDNRSVYYGNYWFHLSLALEVGAHRSVMLIPDMFEKKPHGITKWAARGTTLITYTNLHAIAMNLRTFGYSEDFIRAYHHIFIKELPRQVVTARLNGLRIEWSVIKRLRDHTKNELGTFFLCLVILAIPVIVLQVVKRLWKKS